MSPNEFQRLLGEGFNRIPVAREVLADLDTPLSTYLKLADAPYSYLLESVQGGEKWGRYSIIGLPCRKIVRVRGQRITVEHAGEIVEALECPDPLDWIQDFQSRYRVPVPAKACRASSAGWSAISATTPSAISSPGWPPARIPIRWTTRTFCYWCPRIWWCSTIWPDDCT